MNNLPYEIYECILSNLKVDIVINIINLSKFYRLRIINKSLKNIDNVNDLFILK